MSMSASMYNSPYTYREQLPRINYPPMFAGLSKFSFKHILDSKFLALAALLQAVAIIISLICLPNPFWFKLVFNDVEGTFGSAPVKKKLTLDVGLFFMGGTDMDNVAFLNKLTGRDVMPKPLIAAQVFSVIGSCLLFTCLAGTVILVFRRFASLTATIMLAFFSSIAGVCHILMVVFSILLFLLSSCDPSSADKCDYSSNLVWHMIPLYSQFYRVAPHVTPYVKPFWAFYISIIYAAIVCSGAVILWIEAFMTWQNVSKIRYDQLRQTRNPLEKDVDTRQKGKYVYAPPVQHSAGTYGMQPVIHSSGPYSSNVSDPIDPYGTPRGYPKMKERPPSPGPMRRGPPSVASSTSATPYISREIDL